LSARAVALALALAVGMALALGPAPGSATDAAAQEPGAAAAEPGAGAATGATAEHDWSYDVYNEFMSPYCPGRTLNDCPSEQAEELRRWIAAQEASGRSRAEVEEQLYRVYGDAVLSRPKARGWGLTAYVIPVVGFLAAGGLLLLFLRRQGGGAPGSGPAPPTPVDPELERRIDEELRSGAP